MPILHSQFVGQGKQPDGKPMTIPAPVALAQRGPVVQIAITLADQIATELVKQGKPVPSPVSGFGLKCLSTLNPELSPLSLLHPAMADGAGLKQRSTVKLVLR